jgi:hypothetical protein
MEGSSAPIGRPARREPGVIRATQVGLLVASLGAFLIVFNLFGLAVVGIFLAVGGAALVAPGGFGRSWFAAVALGAIVAALSRLVADGGHETLGGWLAVLGSITILIGATLGFPASDSED